MWPQSSLSAYIAIQGVHTYCIQTQKIFNLIFFLEQLFNVYNNSIRERSSSVTAHVSKCTVSSKNKSSDFVVYCEYLIGKKLVILKYAFTNNPQCLVVSEICAVYFLLRYLNVEWNRWNTKYLRLFKQIQKRMDVKFKNTLVLLQITINKCITRIRPPKDNYYYLFATVRVNYNSWCNSNLFITVVFTYYRFWFIMIKFIVFHRNLL